MGQLTLRDGDEQVRQRADFERTPDRCPTPCKAESPKLRPWPYRHATGRTDRGCGAPAFQVLVREPQRSTSLRCAVREPAPRSVSPPGSASVAPCQNVVGATIRSGAGPDLCGRYLPHDLTCSRSPAGRRDRAEREDQVCKHVVVGVQVRHRHVQARCQPPRDAKVRQVPIVLVLVDARARGRRIYADQDTQSLLGKSLRRTRFPESSCQRRTRRSLGVQRRGEGAGTAQMI